MNKNELVNRIIEIDFLGFAMSSIDKNEIFNFYADENNNQIGGYSDIKTLRMIFKDLKKIYRNLPKFVNDLEIKDDGYYSNSRTTVYKNKDYNFNIVELEEKHDTLFKRLVKHIEITNPYKEYFIFDVIRSQTQSKVARLSTTTLNLDRAKTIDLAGGGGYDKAAAILYKFIKNNSLNFNNIDKLLEIIDKGYFTKLNQSINVVEFNEYIKKFLKTGCEIRFFESKIKGSGEYQTAKFYTLFNYPSIN